MRRIDVFVDSSERQRIDFRISKRMPLYKVMEAYADFYEINPSTLCFRLRGLKIQNSDTASLLNMHTGDVIIVDNVEAKETKETKEAKETKP